MYMPPGAMSVVAGAWIVSEPGPGVTRSGTTRWLPSTACVVALGATSTARFTSRPAAGVTPRVYDWSHRIELGAEAIPGRGARLSPSNRYGGS